MGYSRRLNNRNIANNSAEIVQKCKAKITSIGEIIYNGSTIKILGYMDMNNGQGYYISNKNIYYCKYLTVNQPPKIINEISCYCGKLNNVEKKTFEIIDKDTAKDRNYTYYHGERLYPINTENKNVQRIMPRCRASILDIGNGTYTKRLGYIDINTRDYYFIDEGIIYCSYSHSTGTPNTISCACRKINNIDTNTFKIIDDYRAQDKNHNYIGGKPSN